MSERKFSNMQFLTYEVLCCGNVFGWIDKLKPIHCPYCGEKLDKISNGTSALKDVKHATLILEEFSNA